MRTHSITHGLKAGTRLSVYETPAWALFTERYWPAGPSGERSSLAWHWLTDRVFRFTHKQQKTIIQVPITEKQAAILTDNYFSWASDEHPPVENGISVRVIADEGNLYRPGLQGVTRGTWVDIDDPDGPDTKLFVEFENGASGTFHPTELIDTRLIFERD